MKTITYGVVQELYSLNGDERISYGIAAYFDVENNGTATIVASVNDITDERTKLENLVHNCNRLSLPPESLYDVVEDFLAE